MAQVHDATRFTPSSRRAPNVHSDAVQEAKRLEKMQSHSSSHRTSGTAMRAAGEAKDAAS